MLTRQRDCPGVFRRRASWSRIVCGLAFVLLGSLGVPGNGDVAAGPPPAVPTAPASFETYYVDWNITASGSGASSSESGDATWRWRISVAGSAVVRREQPYGAVTALPFQLTVTDDYERHEYSPCSHDKYSWYVTDPARWMGGPDPFWWDPGQFFAQQRDDGSWYMDDPFNVLFYINGDLARAFSYRLEDDRREWCGGQSSFTTTTMDQIYYTAVFPPLQSKPLEGDSLGTTFTRNETYYVDVLQLTVNFNARVRLACGAAAQSAQASAPLQVCGCQSRPLGSVIDANDPIVTHHEVALAVDKDEIDPEDGTTIMGVVMCDGRFIKNAEVVVKVKPWPPSGMHWHNTPDRPRGYLNLKKITESDKTIELKTEASGFVDFYFRPGKDLANETRGIAGTYEVTIWSKRFPRSEDHGDVFALVQDLVWVGPSANYIYAPREVHRSPGVYGAPQTFNAITQVALDFNNAQLDHNADLVHDEQDPWPIVKPKVCVISLPHGGLYDFYSAYSRPWKPPLDKHLRGYDVEFCGFEPSFPVGTDWLRTMLLKKGYRYGSWYKDPLWRTLGTLNVRPTGAAPTAARPLSGPDLDVNAFLSWPAEWLGAAPGQTITHTIAVNNLDGGAPASNVVVTATLPVGLNFVGATPPATRMAGANQLVWEVGTVLTNTLFPIFKIAAQIGAGVAPGTVLTVTARAGTTDADANPANNYAEAFGVLVQPPGADLAVSSDLAAVAMTIGEAVTFTMQADNFGNLPAAGSALTLTLPTSVTLTSANPVTSTGGAGTFIWNLGTLAPGDSSAVTVTVSLDPRLAELVPYDPDAVTPTLTYTLSVGSAATDFDPTNNIETVGKPVELPGPDLAISLGVPGPHEPGKLMVGEEVTYTITYGNFGNRVAPTTTLTLALWSGLQVLDAQPAPSQTMTSTVFAGGIAGWNLGTLAVGDEGIIRVRVRVNAVGEDGSLVLATIMSGTGDIHPANNVALDRRWAASSALYLPAIRR